MPRTVLLLPLLSLGLLLSACGGGSGSLTTPVALGQPPTATLVVTNHNDDGPGSLRQAIADAPPGAWIVFDDALPAGDVVLDSVLVIEKVLSIGGSDGLGGRHGIDGQGVHQLFWVMNGALQLNDLVLHHGQHQEGGAIYSLFNPVVLWRCHVHHCTATALGGAIAVDKAPLEIYDCFFEANFSDALGGAISSLVAPTRIERTSFYMNESTSGGGAFFFRSTKATIVNAAFHQNSTMFGEGGAIYALSIFGSPETELEVLNSTVTENTAGFPGGGLYVRGEDGVPVTVEMHRSIVALNTAPSHPDTARDGTFASSGGYNMVGVGSGLFFQAVDNNSVGDAFSPFDPELLVPSPLPDGRVVSLPLPLGPCIDAVPAGMNLNPEGEPMLVDLRFLPRFPAQPSDIGCIEL